MQRSLSAPTGGSSGGRSNPVLHDDLHRIQTARQAGATGGLLGWVGTCLDAANVADFEVSNYSGSFAMRKGALAFASILHCYKAGAIDIHGCKDGDPEQVAQMAFDGLEKHFGIQQYILTEQLMTNRPDRKCIQLYLTVLYKSLGQRPMVN